MSVPRGAAADGTPPTEPSPAACAGAADPPPVPAHEGAGEELRGLRILVVMPSVPVQGMERSNLEIMRLLRGAGADVLFVTERHHGWRVEREVERIGCRWAPAACGRRLHLTRRPGEAARVVAAWRRGAGEILDVARVFRPTHVHVTDLAALFYALPALLTVRRPVVVRLPNPPDLYLTGIKRSVSAVLWRHVVARVADVLVCNSDHARSRLAALGIPGGRVRLIYNSVPARDAGRSGGTLALREDRFNVAYVGRIRPEKGVGELVEAAFRIVGERSDVDFHLAGAPSPEDPFAERLAGEIERRGLESRIRIHGAIHDVFGLLRRSRLHVCPSRSANESFPNVVLEAKLHGLPSVVFPVAGLPEAVTHRVDGFVCRAGTADALYEGIRYFLDDPDALGAAGRAAAASLERFSTEKARRAWIDLYRETSAEGRV